MYTTVTKYDFHDAFRDWHGGMYRNNFSYEGRELLFDWLEEIEEQGGAEIEFDVVALCCDYSEETPEDICENYGLDPEGVMFRHHDPEITLIEAVTDYLDEHGYGHCGITEQGTIVYQVF